jgi:hypothetical protein
LSAKNDWSFDFEESSKKIIISFNKKEIITVGIYEGYPSGENVYIYLPKDIDDSSVTFSGPNIISVISYKRGIKK